MNWRGFAPLPSRPRIEFGASWENLLETGWKADYIILSVRFERTSPSSPEFHSRGGCGDERWRLKQSQRTQRISSGKTHQHNFLSQTQVASILARSLLVTDAIRSRFSLGGSLHHSSNGGWEWFQWGVGSVNSIAQSFQSGVGAFDWVGGSFQSMGWWFKWGWKSFDWVAKSFKSGARGLKRETEAFDSMFGWIDSSCDSF